MSGKIPVLVIVMMALLAGAAIYYLQVYAYYRELPASGPAAEVTLVPLGSDTPEAIPVAGFAGIDADSSPIRYRGCFTTPLSLATLTETFRPYEGATPLTAPRWFDCFDAARIGADLESGQAVAFLSAHDIRPGVDRVVAVYPDGRAYAWHQLNESADN